jgi:CBS domain containing-hemolysin-like protein
MIGMLPYLGALLLFLVGLRLSAFFSGVETGFYRASYLRLSIEGQAGDRLAQRILWFRQNPSHFVVTALVGNNVAHYVLTAAVGVAAVRAGIEEGMTAEVVSTLLIAPIVFTFGELIPKNLYYRAPLQLLRRSARWFFVFYRLFLPVSLPLIGLTRILQRFGPSGGDRPDQILSRARLVQVLTQGHQEGLLTDVQSRLVEGLMHLVGEGVTQSMTPSSRVLGVLDNAARQDVLDFARRYGLSNVAVRRLSAADSWYGYVRVIDVAVRQEPLTSLIRPMPEVDARATKLEALLTLRGTRAVYGLVRANEHVLGLVSDHGLTEQLFRTPQAGGDRRAAPA